MQEEWRDIKGYEGRYLISSFGRIYSCCRGKLKYAGKHPVTKEFLKWKYLDE